MRYINTTAHIQQNRESAVTIGNFDGLHHGHRMLIDKVKQYRQYQSVVLSFAPHPLSVLRGVEMETIFTSEERRLLLAEMGIDLFIEYPFTKEFSRTSPRRFMEDILHGQLKCKALVVGEDYRFGKDKAGDGKILKKIGGSLGMEVVLIPHIHNETDGGKISSTDIRRFIGQGKIEKANALLDRNFFLMGTVAFGKKIGRTIGFPTINVLPPSGKLLPLDGVYITLVEIIGRHSSLFHGVTNIGSNPTVGGSYKTVETFLLDFADEIYGSTVRISFLRRLRGVKKFDSIEELKAQISLDIETTKSYFHH